MCILTHISYPRQVYTNIHVFVSVWYNKSILSTPEFCVVILIEDIFLFPLLLITDSVTIIQLCDDIGLMGQI